MVNHAPRISRCYQDISGSLLEWANISNQFIVCQHDADEKVNKTHVHIGIWGVNVQEEAMKRQFNKHSGLGLKGNEDWKWKYKRFPNGLPDWTECVVLPDGTLATPPAYLENLAYLKYLIKGDLSRVKFVKNISPAILEEARDAWVDSVKNDNSLTITLIERKREKLPPYQQIVMNDASIKWYEYKREQEKKKEDIEDTQVIEYVCDAMRKCSRGINPHMVRDLSYGVLYDDAEYRDIILKKCRKFF